MKKSLLILSLLAIFLLTGCAPSATSNTISVISREGGSGTRSAFIELFSIEVKGEDGTRTDHTTIEAIIANQNGVMMANIAGNKSAIGYCSLGSLNETVKAVPIDGVTPSAETVKAGSYAAARPFYVATAGEAQGLAADFIAFILSAEGQAVVGQSYITVVENAQAYAGERPAGKLVVGGSSSVTPVMEKLKEAYLVLNPDATIEIQQSDSSSGLSAAVSGTVDVGMSSRELKAAELESLTPVRIALDGIAIVVHNENPVTQLTSEQVRQIFTGEITAWGDVTQ